MQFNHPSYPGRPVHSHIMKGLLGLASSDKLPREGMPPRFVQATEKSRFGHTVHWDVKVWVNPLVGEAEPGTYRRLAKRSTHRVMCECPHCGKQMSAGRLFQHSC